MAIAYLTRKVRFNAAHRYHRPDWSEARNREIFGACANPYGHGHNYLLEVTVCGKIDPITGFSVDLPRLDALLQREIVARYDHQHLNHAVPDFRDGGLIPTSENIAVHCWHHLVDGLPDGVRLHRLRLHEDTTFYIDYYGGGEPA